MRIGVDLDGCVYDFASDFRKWVHQSTGKPWSELPEATEWRFYESWGMTTQDYLDSLAAGCMDGRVFYDGDPIPDALTELRYLADKGHELHIVTNRMFEGARENTLHWLGLWRVPFTSLTFSPDKTVVPVDVFIEDNVENAAALLAAGTPVALFDQPWNRGFDDAVRCEGWSAVATYCQAVGNGVERKANRSSLEEAQSLVHGDRGDDYGHPIDDFTRTGRMWGAILDLPDVPPEKVGLCMAAVKISREVNKPKRDNRVDLAGYAETVDMVMNRKAAA